MIRIKDFHKFQVYKDRSPPWICLHRKLLDDPEWFSLPKDAAFLLVNLWLIASEDKSRNGRLPCVAKLAFRLRMSEEKINKLLTSLNHWIVQDDTNPYQSVSSASLYVYPSVSVSDSQSGKEVVTTTDSHSARQTICKSDWEPKPATVQVLQSEGISREAIDAARREMIDWSQAGQKRKHDWDATLRNWCRRNKPKGSRSRDAMQRNLERFS